jgi:hypothetical protein
MKGILSAQNKIKISDPIPYIRFIFYVDLPEGEFYEKPIHLKGSREHEKMSYSPRFSHGFLFRLRQHSLRGSELGYVHLEQYGWCVRGLCLCE